MAKYRVTLGDGRTVDVFAPSEDAALGQADHAEATRVEIATRRAKAASEISPELKAMIDKYGPTIVTQIMRATQPDFVMPEMSNGGAVNVTVSPFSQDVPLTVTPAAPTVAVRFLKV